MYFRLMRKHNSENFNNSNFDYEKSINKSKIEDEILQSFMINIKSNIVDFQDSLI